MERMTWDEFATWKKSVDRSEIETLPDNLPAGCVLWGLSSIKRLPDTLPKTCGLYGLHSLKKLPDTLPEGCVLGGLISLETLPDRLPKSVILFDLSGLKTLPNSLPEGCQLCGLHRVEELPNTLPEDCALSCLSSLKRLPDRLPSRFEMQGPLSWCVTRGGDTFRVGSETHPIEHWRKHFDEIADNLRLPGNERDKLQQILDACKPEQSSHSHRGRDLSNTNSKTVDLVCQTSDDDGNEGMKYGVLSLDAEAVLWLRSLMTAVQPLRSQHPTFYRAHFFIGLVSYHEKWRSYKDDEGDFTEALDECEADVDSYKWAVLPEGYEIRTEAARLDAPSLGVDEDSVVFAAYLRDGGAREVETQVLSRDLLDEVDRILQSRQSADHNSNPEQHDS